jgi:hypothetical protein
LSLGSCVVGFWRMAYLTLAAEIDHGRITVAEPDKLPVTGKALLTVLDSPGHKPDWNKIEAVLGTLKTNVDAAEWERQIRVEWDERERAQWDKR